MSEDQTQRERVPGTRVYRETGTHPTISQHTKMGLKLFCGSGSQELGLEAAEHLGIQPGKYLRKVFSNENIFIKLQESVRGQDVYLIQSHSRPVHRFH